MSLPEIDLARYQKAEARAYREEEWINNQAECLFDTLYNPSNPAVFLDALADAGDGLIQSLRPLLKQEVWDTAAIGQALCTWVEAKCWEESYQRAEDELEELQ